jgi:hypothetical protein
MKEVFEEVTVWAPLRPHRNLLSCIRGSAKRAIQQRLATLRRADFNGVFYS